MSKPTLTALNSLYGETFGREQSIGSPSYLLDPLRDVWGSIALDPCGWEDNSHVSAERTLVWPRDNGLAATLVDKTYINPPYGKCEGSPSGLRPWLLCQDRIEDENARIAWLVPVRPHRPWWRYWARWICDDVIFLDPFRFVGHTHTFPGPICLGYKGADHATIVEAYRHYGASISR